MGRDEATLEPFLHFLITHITNPIYSTLLLDACNTLFGKYLPTVLPKPPNDPSRFVRKHCGAICGLGRAVFQTKHTDQNGAGFPEANLPVVGLFRHANLCLRC